MNRRSFLGSLLLAPFAAKAALSARTITPTVNHSTLAAERAAAAFKAFLAKSAVPAMGFHEIEYDMAMSPDVLGYNRIHLWCYEIDGSPDYVNSARLHIPSQSLHGHWMSCIRDRETGVMRHCYPEAQLLVYDGAPNRFRATQVHDVTVIIEPERLIGLGVGGPRGIDRLLMERRITLLYCQA